MNVQLFLEIKNEYTEHLVDTLTPYIYEGLNSMYQSAVETAKKAIAEDKILIIFQKILQSVPEWNQLRIEEETNRIKQMSNTNDYMDDLVRAVVKSNIILLAYSNNISSIVGQAFYSTLTTQSFIHKCYIECSKDAHNNPFLFFHDIEPMDLKRNQIMINRNIQSGIIRAIRKILPISLILKEYLVNTINIIPEQQQVSLVGKSVKANDVIPPKPNDIIPPVVNMIKTEDSQSSKQKIKAIMQLDKLLSQKAPSESKPVSLKNIQTTVSMSDLQNKHLNKSDKDIINIDFNEKTTEAQSKESDTTISEKSIYKLSIKGKQINETSEAPDPNKIDLIENYGIRKTKK